MEDGAGACIDEARIGALYRRQGRGTGCLRQVGEITVRAAHPRRVRLCTGHIVRHADNEDTALMNAELNADTLPQTLPGFLHPFSELDGLNEQPRPVPDPCLFKEVKSVAREYEPDCGACLF